MNKDFLIPEKVIDIIEMEGNKMKKICANLNEDSTYINSARAITNRKNLKAKQISELLIMRDLVEIHDRLVLTVPPNETISTLSKFILIYLYELFLGNSLSKAFNLERIKRIPSSKQFKPNVEQILKTAFFPVSEDFKSEILSTLVLQKIDHNAFLDMSSFLKKVILITIKSDGKKSSKKDIFLKQILLNIDNPEVINDQFLYKHIIENDTLEKVLSELNNLVGLEEIKKNINNLINFLEVQKLREQQGLRVNQNSLHSVFMGPPGTGKTTVARLLGRIYKHLGYLKKGHLIETDRSGMVAGYVGQTAIKTDAIIDQAKDGVLFIDEAYALTGNGLNDFGQEAIEVLLKRMEDFRDNLIVIAAGYEEEMQVFIQSNPGLQSRFSRYFTFDHYDEKSLLAIFKMQANKYDFRLTKDAEEKLSDIINGILERENDNFGNARVMRNLFEKIIERQANRIVKIQEITKNTLVTILEEDIPEIKKTIQEMIVFK